MTPNQSLIARAALGVLVGGASIIVCAVSHVRHLPRRSFDVMINLVFIISRLGIYLGVFFVLRFAPRGDIRIYWDQATAVLQHLHPYRDFRSSYSPLHPYLDATAIHVWFSPLAIILLSICVEAFVLPLWLRVGRIFLTEPDMRSGALLYLTSAISVQFVAIDGQDNVIVAVLLVLSLLLAYRKYPLISGVLVGSAVAVIKFLPLLYFPAFLGAMPQRWRWLLGASVVNVLVYGYFRAHHLPILQPLLYESGVRSAGNVPYVFEGLTGFTIPSIVWDSLALLVCGFLFFLIARACRQTSFARRLHNLTFGFAALTLALVLFSKKSWPPYLMLALFPICLLVKSKDRLQTVAFALFGVVALVAHSYWATDMALCDAITFHKGLLAHGSKYLLFLVLQVGLITGYFWLLFASVRKFYEESFTSRSADFTSFSSVSAL